jgi:uncharacterized repeat protein (TIGR03803 family)
MRITIQAAAAAAGLVFFLPFIGRAEASPQYKVLYAFCPSGTCTDGRGPSSRPILDKHGNVFGATSVDEGLVYEVSTKGKETVVHQFCSSCGEGTTPVGNLIMDVRGNLYGVTNEAGPHGSGAIYELSPGKNNTWTLTTLYGFCAEANCTDGVTALAGLTYDGAQSGALYDGKSPLYGTTQRGGTADAGVAYELSLKHHGKKITYSVIYNFCTQANCADGGNPQAGLLPDGKGNLYGTAADGGGTNRDGVVFELASENKTFVENVLYSFCTDASCPDGDTPGPIVSDTAGNLYGVAVGGGTHGSGAIFKLTSSGKESVLYSFCSMNDCADGMEPNDVTIASDGSLWGTTYLSGTGEAGTLFQLKNGKFTVVHAFCSATNCSDGGEPDSAVTFDASGNAFGTTSTGGSGAGTVYRITP